MERVAFFVLFTCVAILAAVAVTWPAAVMRVRAKFGFGDSFWSGGWFYSTIARTRITGGLLLAISLLALLSGGPA